MYKSVELLVQEPRSNSGIDLRRSYTFRFQNNIVINEIPIKPNELKVVVDSMLHGLGKELRRCGVDAVIVDNDAEHSEVARVKCFLFSCFKCSYLVCGCSSWCNHVQNRPHLSANLVYLMIKIARTENRYALTSGMPFISVSSNRRGFSFASSLQVCINNTELFLKIRSQLAEGRAINIQNANAKQQCAQVLKLFNVKIQLSDLFSRCRVRQCCANKFWFGRIWTMNLSSTTVEMQYGEVWNSAEKRDQISLLQVQKWQRPTRFAQYRRK